MVTIHEDAFDAHNSGSRRRQHRSDCSLRFQEEDEGVKKVKDKRKVKRGDGVARKEDSRSISREDIRRVAAFMEDMGGFSEEEWVDESHSRSASSEESKAVEDDDLGTAGLFGEVGSYDSRDDEDYVPPCPAEESRGNDVNGSAGQQSTCPEIVPCTKLDRITGQCTTLMA